MSAAKKVPIPPRGVDYRGKIVLAPMVRSGELPSRLSALYYGADLVWGPETVDRAMIGTTRRVNDAAGTIEWTRTPSHGQKVKPTDAKESIIYKLHPARESSRLIFQIGTSDPARAVACARLVAADVAGIDVNAGCPKPFSTSGGMGAALLQTPDLLCAILEALVAEIVPEFGIGISVKIRLLETAAQTEKLVRRLVATGITGLTIHCRTTPMRPREAAIRGQLKMIADVCREAGVACLMNGDVASRDEALVLMEEYGVDGAMIATAAEKNPSCFRAEADGGIAPWDEVVEYYVKTAMEVENKFGNTKFLLGNMVPGKEQAHSPITQVKSYTQTCERLGFTHLVEQAKATDILIGLGGDGDAASKKKGRQAIKSALAAGGQMGKARKLEKEERKVAKAKVPSQQAEVVSAEVAPAVAASSA
ncbi:related to tRNA dihydrouridine synthase [Cephalotrichum gorgonifer]|uniref:Related to tRNA dihydrouridine synthase n=1 Tax=Cephalotrichum gorgonifer TaxID=2041049 RepID=A0AAE8MUP2_9PEZI|nr:related to tRNA dihydrouridine synthase [Cephalotrichum gorgonifer]